MGQHRTGYLIPLRDGYTSQLCLFIGSRERCIGGVSEGVASRSYDYQVHASKGVFLTVFTLRIPGVFAALRFLCILFLPLLPSLSLLLCVFFSCMDYRCWHCWIGGHGCLLALQHLLFCDYSGRASFLARDSENAMILMSERLVRLFLRNEITTDAES